MPTCIGGWTPSLENPARKFGVVIKHEVYEMLPEFQRRIFVANSKSYFGLRLHLQSNPLTLHTVKRRFNSISDILSSSQKNQF